MNPSSAENTLAKGQSTFSSNNTIDKKDDMMILDNQQEESKSLYRSPSPEMTAQQALAIGKAHGLQPFDVICGRCSLAFNNVGNRRFRVVIGMNVQRYIDAASRTAKSHVIRNVVKIFREDIGASFVKQGADGKFVLVSDKVVRQKVGHALRDHATFHLGNGIQLRSSSSSCREVTRSNTSISSSNASFSSDLSQQSTQSAPVNQRSTNAGHAILPTRESLTLNYRMDESWADDLSIGSFDDDQPFGLNDIFPPGTIDVPADEIIPSRPLTSSLLLAGDPLPIHQQADSIMIDNFLCDSAFDEETMTMEEPTI